MRRWLATALAACAALLFACSDDKSPTGIVVPINVDRPPPFAGTIFLDPDIITDSDRTTFTGVTYAGRAPRSMFDRRVDNFVSLSPHLFNATFDDGLRIEIQVNPEFGSADEARALAVKYGTAIGRLPNALRRDVRTAWIHAGIQPFGGGNDNLLIHTGQAALYENDGILEETLVHEAAHTSLDARYGTSSGWRAAQVADRRFISSYAAEFPQREDIAESFLPYLAIRYRRDRIDDELDATIRAAMPNRIAYFDGLGLAISPVD